MPEEIYLKTDELNEAIRNFEMLGIFLSKVILETYNWKWVIIFLHLALQGFMVNALKGTSGLNVLKDRIAEKWLELYREGSANFVKEYLDFFLSLYEKIKSDIMLQYFHSKKFIPNETQDESIEKLNELRNRFIHFLPQYWLIEVSGLPDIVNDCISIIDFLSFESGNIWLNETIQEKLRNIIAEIYNNINLIKTIYKI